MPPARHARSRSAGEASTGEVRPPWLPDNMAEAGDLQGGFGGQAYVGSGLRIVGRLPRGSGPLSSCEDRKVLLSVDVTRTPDGRLASRYGWCMTLGPATSAKITEYRPRHAPPEWDLVADQVRMLVAASAHMSRYSVERLLHATARLAIWCHRQGLPDDPQVWLRHETIDAFVLTGCADLAPRSAQTYRTWLRRMRAALAWIERGEHSPPPMTAPAHRLPPYGATQLARLRNWAENLTGQARGDALALMGLAAGCGWLGRLQSAPPGGLGWLHLMIFIGEV